MTGNGLFANDNADDNLADQQKALYELKGEDTIDNERNSSDGQSFKELFEESLKSIHEGKVVTGEIVYIDKEFVLVDIGYKSEGQIRTSEFLTPDGRLTAEVGDRVDVLLVRKEDKEGRIILSKEKAARVKKWDEVEDIYKNQGTIRGKIMSQVKGGLSVDVGLQAFLPGSQADLRPIRDLGTLVGTEHDFKILKFEKDQKNIVLSRRAALEAERKALMEKTVERLEKDAILDGIVSNITRFGLFVDLGGIDGLVHITDISWGKVGNPSEIYRIGDKIKVKLLNFDKEKGRISLGIKQLSPDPWQGAQDKYPLDAVITGPVTRLKDFGAFVALEEGIEGLIHLSEISWTGNLKHPSQQLSVGDVVETVVINIDTEKRRISLSMKQLKPNPWDTIADNYPIGAIIEGEIKSITDFGIFLELETGVEGLIHISQIPNGKRKKLTERFRLDDKIKAEVVNISVDDKRIGLSIRKMDESSGRDLQKGLKNQQKKVASNIGELLKEKMVKSQSETLPEKPESPHTETTESDVPNELAHDPNENEPSSQ